MLEWTWILWNYLNVNDYYQLAVPLWEISLQEFNIPNILKNRKVLVFLLNLSKQQTHHLTRDLKLVSPWWTNLPKGYQAEKISLQAQRWRVILFWHSCLLRRAGKEPGLPNCLLAAPRTAFTILASGMTGTVRAVCLFTRPFPHATKCVSYRQHKAGFCFLVHSDSNLSFNWCI